ncbi:hypothetical protein JOC74_003026 [Bacillus capparidis]|uniref:Uncharacterized protein n=1 Tax=Bacillus capparidis TaxID=1840411 RepID=A0ABS4CYV0_9BACI|nr:hypothetical protein [Bacillus capparidis]
MPPGKQVAGGIIKGESTPCIYQSQGECLEYKVSIGPGVYRAI